MFTIEFLPTHTLITTLDEEDMCEDLQVVMTDETVYLMQHDDILQESSIIMISYQQLLDIVASLNNTEGCYYVERGL